MKNKSDEERRIRVGERVSLVRRGKKGIWQMEFHFQGHRLKSTRTKNLKFAKRKAFQIEAQLIDGTFELATTREPAESVSIQFAIESYISHHKAEGARRRTYVRYQGMLNLFSERLVEKGISMLEDVEISHIDKYREARQTEIGALSMYKEGTTIKRFLTWCEERKLISSNPLGERIFKRPKNTKKKNVLTLGQVNSILKKATPNRRFIFAMLAFTGMRISELRNLLIEDVDLDGNWIYIRSRDGLKNKPDSDWDVPIHERLKAIIESMDQNESGFFFTALPSKQYPSGDHFISPKRINEDFKKILKQLGIPAGRQGGFTIHSLRHFFKTHCITSGIAKPVVDEWQGHELKRKASDQYFHLTPEVSQRLMKQVPFDTSI